MDQEQLLAPLLYEMSDLLITTYLFHQHQVDNGDVSDVVEADDQEAIVILLEFIGKQCVLSQSSIR